MSKFNTKSSTETINKAGGKAYSMSSEMELVHAVLTTFLNDKYYESGGDRMKRIKDLVSKNDPKFVANLAYVARTEFYLRSVTHLLLGELSKVHKGDGLVSKAIEKCVVRADDILEIVAYLGKDNISNQIKKGIRRALLKFNRYKLAKYKGTGDWKMKDVFRIVHPRSQFANEEQKKAWKDLMNDKLKQENTWENNVKDLPKLLKEEKLGYMALLRNLNNLQKYGDAEVISLAIKQLTDRENVKKSKQLPFRFMTAFDNVEGDRSLTDAISLAMDIAVDNVPELPGKTLIAVDSSGSMSGDPINKAAIFGATLVKANVNADLILYDTAIKESRISTRTPVIDIANSIKNEAMGGGTMTSLVFDYALNKKIKYDRVIIISDNESWKEGWSGDSVQDHYNSYKKGIGADPFVYAIDIEGYGTKDVEGGRVFHLTGWSNRLLDFIGKVEGGDSLIKYIKSLKIYDSNKENKV